MVLSGKVDSVGPDARSFEVGQLVFGFDQRRFGTYAQYVCWPEDGLLSTRPANLTDDEAAAIPYGGLLALHFLRKADVRAGQRVLIYGASGAVGTSAVQLARHFGAEVTGVCGTSNVDLVASLGATTVIDYSREDFTNGTTRYDVILDAVGKRKSAASLRRCRQVLTRGGACVSVDDGRPNLRREDLVLLAELATKGEIRPVIDRTYALEDIAEAHRYVDNGHKRGNVVIAVAACAGGRLEDPYRSSDGATLP
jgi:NADPH:quinone reductase-like Zn-dependent oxidoreductase